MPSGFSIPIAIFMLLIGGIACTNINPTFIYFYDIEGKQPITDTNIAKRNYYYQIDTDAKEQAKTTTFFNQALKQWTHILKSKKDSKTEEYVLFDSNQSMKYRIYCYSNTPFASSGEKAATYMVKLEYYLPDNQIRREWVYDAKGTISITDHEVQPKKQDKQAILQNAQQIVDRTQQQIQQLKEKKKLEFFEIPGYDRSKMSISSKEIPESDLSLPPVSEADWDRKEDSENKNPAIKHQKSDQSKELAESVGTKEVGEVNPKNVEKETNHAAMEPKNNASLKKGEKKNSTKNHNDSKGSSTAVDPTTENTSTPHP